MGLRARNHRARRMTSYFVTESGPIPSHGHKDLVLTAPAHEGGSLPGDMALPSRSVCVPRSLGVAGYIFYLRHVVQGTLDVPAVVDSLLAATGILLGQEGVIASEITSPHRQLARALWTLCLLAVFRPCMQASLLESFAEKQLRVDKQEKSRVVEQPGGVPATSPEAAPKDEPLNRPAPVPSARKRKGTREPTHVSPRQKRSAALRAPSTVDTQHMPRNDGGSAAPADRLVREPSPSSSTSSHMQVQVRPGPVQASGLSGEDEGRGPQRVPSRLGPAEAHRDDVQAAVPSRQDAPINAEGTGTVRAVVNRDPRRRPQPTASPPPCTECPRLRIVVDELEAEVDLYKNRLEGLSAERDLNWIPLSEHKDTCRALEVRATLQLERAVAERQAACQVLKERAAQQLQKKSTEHKQAIIDLQKQAEQRYQELEAQLRWEAGERVASQQILEHSRQLAALRESAIAAREAALAAREAAVQRSEMERAPSSSLRSSLGSLPLDADLATRHAAVSAAEQKLSQHASDIHSALLAMSSLAYMFQNCLSNPGAADSQATKLRNNMGPFMRTWMGRSAPGSGAAGRPPGSRFT